MKHPLVFLLAVFLISLGLAMKLHTPGCPLSCGGKEVFAAAFAIAALVSLTAFVAVAAGEVAKLNAKD